MQLVSIPPALLSTQQTGNRLRPRQLTTQGKTVLSLYADAPNILIHLQKLWLSDQLSHFGHRYQRVQISHRRTLVARSALRRLTSAPELSLNLPKRSIELGLHAIAAGIIHLPVTRQIRDRAVMMGSRHRRRFARATKQTDSQCSEGKPECRAPRSVFQSPQHSR